MSYEEMTLTELKELCKEKGLKNFSTLKKNELIELLSSTEPIVQANHNIEAKTT